MILYIKLFSIFVFMATSLLKISLILYKFTCRTICFLSSVCISIIIENHFCGKQRENAPKSVLYALLYFTICIYHKLSLKFKPNLANIFELTFTKIAFYQKDSKEVKNEAVFFYRTGPSIYNIFHKNFFFLFFFFFFI